MGIGVVVVAIGLVAAFTSDSRKSSNTASRCVTPKNANRSAIKPPPPVPARTRYGPGRTPLCGFTEVAVVVRDSTGNEVVRCLLLAETEAQTERGLMQVTDPLLGGYDGMLFRFDRDQPADGGFYMRDTPMPLTIAYLDAEGHLVAQRDMSPCSDRADCPTYPPGRPFRMAVEVARGRLAHLGLDVSALSQLATAPKGRTCPAAT